MKINARSATIDIAIVTPDRRPDDNAAINAAREYLATFIRDDAMHRVKIEPSPDYEYDRDTLEYFVSVTIDC